MLDHLQRFYCRNQAILSLHSICGIKIEVLCLSVWMFFQSSGKARSSFVSLKVCVEFALLSNVQSSNLSACLLIRVPLLSPHSAAAALTLKERPMCTNDPDRLIIFPSVVAQQRTWVKVNNFSVVSVQSDKSDKYMTVLIQRSSKQSISWK